MQGYRAVREPTARVKASKWTGTGHSIWGGLGAQGSPRLPQRKGSCCRCWLGRTEGRGGEDGSDMSQPAVAVQVSLSLCAREPYCPWS